MRSRARACASTVGARVWKEFMLGRKGKERRKEGRRERKEGKGTREVEAEAEGRALEAFRDS